MTKLEQAYMEIEKVLNETNSKFSLSTNKRSEIQSVDDGYAILVPCDLFFGFIPGPVVEKVITICRKYNINMYASEDGLVIYDEAEYGSRVLAETDIAIVNDKNEK